MPSKSPLRSVPVDGPRPRPDDPWAPDVLQLALDAAAMAVWEIDLGTRAMRGSPGLHRLLDLDAAPMRWSLSDIEDSLLPDDVDVFRAAIARALQEGELRCELRTRRRDGRIGWLAVLGRVTRDLGGGARRLVGALQDVSDRKDSERFVGESRAQWSAMFEMGEIGMAEIETATNAVVRANTRLCEIL